MRNAELTASSTNPLPAQRPWSGGSNCWLKFASRLSLLLTPLKLCSNEVATGVTAADADAGPAAGEKAPLDLGVERAPRCPCRVVGPPVAAAGRDGADRPVLAA